MRKQSGFTLLEIMVVVVIMGMLSAIVATNVMGQKSKAEIETARINIKNFQDSLELYRLDNHYYPTTEQGLDALVSKPTISPVPKNYNENGYIRELPQDPWGNDYIYLNPGNHNPRSYDIYSAGPDGESDTEDDVGNWKGNSEES
ncbi:MAG: type II secretion system major pseudopilin GspG [Succinivibrionaceae bacterium]